MSLENTTFDGTKETSALKREEKGAVLIITLLVTVALLILIMPFLSKLSGQYRASDRSFKSYAALNLAEAGVEMAIWELNHGDISSWDGDSTARTMTLSSVQTSEGNTVGDVVISVSFPENDISVIESIGKIPFRNTDTVDRTLRVELTKDSSTQYDNALFGDTGMELSGNSFVDSYDSRLGKYGLDKETGFNNIGSEGHIATNGTFYGSITLENNATVNGNAMIGDNGDPENILVLNNSELTGEKTALSSPQPMLPVPPPVGLVFKGGYSLEGGFEEDKKGKMKFKGGKDIITESGEYSAFIISEKSEVKIIGDVILYITGELTMENKAKFKVEKGSSLQIYLGGTFNQNNNSKFDNKSKDPTALSILGTDDFSSSMTWYSNSDFYGTVYLPQSTLDLSSNIDIYGSMMANYIDVASNARIHYDKALEEVDILQFENPLYYVRSWQETRYP